MKWLICPTLLLFIALACADLVPIPTKESDFPIGVSGNGTIWYQSNGNNGKPITFGNVLNPINVSIVYDIDSINYQAQICLNSFEFDFPISGVNLESNCPTGSLGHASNASSSSIPHFKSVGSYTTETVTAQVYVKPTSKGGLVATIPESIDLQYFQLSWFGFQCSGNTYPVGANNTCVTISPLTTGINGTLEAGSSIYYVYEVTSSNLNTLELNITGLGDGLKVYVQRDYYPTREWYLNALTEENDDEDYISVSIVNPSVGEKYFFMVYNSDKKDTLNYGTTLTEKTCDGSKFGYLCTHDSADTESPLTGYLRISSSFGTNSSGAVVNDGDSKAFDFYDDDESYPNEMAYFSLGDYPTLPTPYFIRVSVANNNPSDLNRAPALYAKRGGYPSAQSNHYNVSTIGDVTHQILIPITEDDLIAQTNAPGGVLPTVAAWFIGVQLPSDFSIWVGVNCADDCSTGDEVTNSCNCNGKLCSEQYDSYQNYNFLYERPTNVSDSNGACQCEEEQKEFSFNCNAEAKSNTVLYLALIAIAGAVILSVAIGVPLYCFITNRRAAREPKDTAF